MDGCDVFTVDRMYGIVYVQYILSQGMGFPPELCEPAVKEFGSVQSSIDAILAGRGTRKLENYMNYSYDLWPTLACSCGHFHLG